MQSNFDSLRNGGGTHLPKQRECQEITRANAIRIAYELVDIFTNTILAGELSHSAVALSIDRMFSRENNIKNW